MEQRGRWYRRRSCSIFLSVHPMSDTSEFVHYLICHSIQTCDKKQTNAHWLDTTIQDTAIQFVCEPVLHLVLLASLEHMIVCVCVCVALTAKVFDPISEVGVPADSLTLREKQRHLSNVQQLRRLLRKMRSDMLPFTIVYLFIYLVCYCGRIITLPVDNGRCMSATKDKIHKIIIFLLLFHLVSI